MVSIIELDKVFAEIAGIVDKVSLAVELVMSFVIGAGLMLLWATMAQSFSLKLKQAAILRALGARQAFIRNVFRFEYVWLAIIASLVALCATELSAYLVYQGIFDINARIHYPWWLVTPAFMLTFMLLSSRRAVSHIAASPPNAILRGEF
jgi:putative ABC transport system permease protein